MQRNYGVDQRSLPRLPPQSILHPGHIPDPPFEVPARFAVALFGGLLILFFIAAYYGAVFLFGV